MSQKQSSVWFITGCSSGFGRELARAVVARGFRAVVTARDPKQVADVVAGHEDRALALRLDVTDPAQVAESVRRAGEQRRDWLLRRGRGERRGGRPTDVRNRLLRPRQDDPRGAARDAEAPQR